MYYPIRRINLTRLYDFIKKRYRENYRGETMKGIVIAVILTLGIAALFGQTILTEQTHPIPGIYKSAVDWGDFDNDGDLDLLIAGLLADDTSIARIYRNNTGTFVDVNAGIPGFSSASVAWGDYDKDGDLDFAISGLSGGLPLSKIYNNSGGEFSSNILATITGLEGGALAWGDADNDGDLDLLTTGKDSTGAPKTLIYINSLNATGENDFSTFITIASGVWASSVAWGDFDNDGDSDFVLTGATATTEITEIWRNTAGAFAKLSSGVASILGVSLSSVAWGDYDNDGDLDLFVAGKKLTTYYTNIYRNDLAGNTATFVSAVSLPGVQNCSLALGDYDNDGDLDLLLTGEFSDGTTATNYTQIYRNNDHVFFLDPAYGYLPGVRFSSVAWGDYDSDGDLDLILCGLDNNGIPQTKLYASAGAAANLAPVAPGNLNMVQEGEYLKFSWTPGSDLITPELALTYALRIGTSSGGIEVLPSHASSTGFRLKSGAGYASSTCFWMIKATAMPFGNFYWSVQTIDGAFKGSAWATQSGFNGGRILSPNGGESWQAGSLKTIYWYSVSNTTNVNIYVSGNNGVAWTKLNTTAVLSNLGRFQFTVPDLISSQCLMKVEDNSNTALYDISDASFTIGFGPYPSITVIYPNDLGTKLQVGHQYYISWASSGVSNIKIELSLDEGQSFSTVVASVPAANNSYLATIPDTPASLCYFRLSSTSDLSVYDMNDNPFSIVKLSVNFPNMGDHVLAPPPTTNKLNVSWISSGIATLKVELSIDGGTNWRVLAASAPAPIGTYAGTISAADISSECLVRISDTTDNTVTAQSSGLFSIADLDLTYPSASAIKLQTGRSYPITWTQLGVSAPLKIQYATNYTSTNADWITIAENIAASDSLYNWTVPQVQASSTCRIRISAQDQDNFADISDNNFSISSLMLSSPNGGETWFYPPARMITWTSSLVTNLKIELSLDGGNSWPVTIANSVTASSGTYSWTASEYNSPNAMIKITDTASAGNVYDTSDNPFVLHQLLQVLMPNGGETLIAGSTYNIRWRAEPEIPAIKLDYTANNGSSWTTITSTAINAALGTYAWTVPATLSTNYKIRIRRDPATTPNTIDLSDSKFTVANTIPEVAFIGDPLVGFQPLEVQFTDQTPMLSAPITSWLWNFGDGQSSTEQHPLHMYQTPGTYSVTLTVDNDIDAPRSLTKPDYILVQGNVAQITLLSEAPVSFYAEAGETTGWAQVTIQNTGTSNLLISSVQASHPGFGIMYENLQSPILPGATDVIYVRYTAAEESPVQAILTIGSNAADFPLLPVALVANDVPVPVQNLNVSIVNDSAVLTWNPVTMSVLGNAMLPDMYIVEYNEVAEDDIQAYYYLSATADTTFTHYLVARYEDMMFYRVLAVKDLSPALIRYLQTADAKQEKITWKHLKQRFTSGIPDRYIQTYALPEK